MKVLKPLHHFLLLLLAVGLVFGLAALSSAAQAQPQSQSQTQAQSGSQSQTQAQAAKTDNDITRRELRNFDQFLDSHPEVAEALRKDPNLINNPNWVSKHPGVRDWLEDHPNARQELKENPTAFMHREQGFEKQEGKEGDITRGEVHNFDQFLDSHPEVAEGLRKDPNLINNPNWVSKHPELKDWLEDHPNARQELKENPAAFMHREKGFEKQEGKEGDITARELRIFDQYLDNHPDVAQALSRNPKLINNPDWLSKHPELKEWLENHPYASKKIRENPRAFMRREGNFEKHDATERQRVKP